MARIAFCQNYAHEYLGLMYLSAALKKEGHEVDVFLYRGQGKKNFLSELSRFKPDLIGFYCITGNFNWAREFAFLVKEVLPVLTIFGGPHPTICPEIINQPSIDIVCRGEGELTLCELAKKLDKKEDFSALSGLWVKIGNKVFKNDMHPLIEDLDNLPFPDRDLYPKKYPFLERSQKFFLAGRGCPFECSFCVHSAVRKLYQGEGQYVRFRQPSKVIDEIEFVKNNYFTRTVYMRDDTFILNQNFIHNFAHEYHQRVALPLICLVRADLLNEGVVRNLYFAGCRKVFMGVETGSEERRERILKKKITNQQIYQAASLLKKYKIKFRAYNMLGLPEETLNDAWETVKINNEIKPDYPYCFLFFPYPGTVLGEYAKTKGLVETESLLNEPSYLIRSLVSSPVKHELENLQKLFFYAVKFPWLSSLIKGLIKIRRNIFFDLAFVISYTWCTAQSENLRVKELFAFSGRLLNYFLSFQKNNK